MANGSNLSKQNLLVGCINAPFGSPLLGGLFIFLDHEAFCVSSSMLLVLVLMKLFRCVSFTFIYDCISLVTC